MPAYGIGTLYQVAAFLATIAIESGQFRWLKEIWGPTEAQLRYDTHPGLGNILPGDGKKYMGRGLIQLTGRNNYTWLSRRTGVDYLNNPQWLERPLDATIASCIWWEGNGCNELANIPDFRAVTHKVNGGYNAWELRKLFYTRNLQVLSTPNFSNVLSGVTTTAGLPDSQ